MGDFLGFTFGGVHSSDLGITRVSGGDRYDEQLHPEIKDRTAEVPGVNGNYYFGSDFGPKTIDIEIAYDHLTEWQLKRIRKIFSTKENQKLIFDEHPYKYYIAKLANPIELSYVCFDEPYYTWKNIPAGPDAYVQGISGDFEYKAYDGTTQRIYKGEGKLSFICYFPFAKSVYKQLPFHFQLTTDTVVTDKKYFILNNTTHEYERVVNPVQAQLQTYYERVNEESTKDWAFSSGILSVNQYEDCDKYDTNEHIISIYNPGDVDTGFRLYIPYESLGENNILTYNAGNSNHNEISQLVFNKPSAMKPYKYTVVPDDITGNPHESNWYEFILGEYVLSEDESKWSNKTYYIRFIDIGILIDTNNSLIIGVSEVGIDKDMNHIIYTSGNLYNDCINSGFFFKFKPNIIDERATLYLEGIQQGVEIFYDYLYF